MTQLLTDPKLKGKVTLLGEMADTLGLVLIDNGDDPTDVSDEAFDRAIKSVQDALDAGQILKFTGNDYGPPLARGRLRGVRRLVWRPRPARSREREPEMGRAREGRDHLDRQHVHPARRQRPDRVDVHELRLRPEDLGADRPRNGYISSVKGVKDEALKLDPKAALERARVPERPDACEPAQNDPNMVSNADFITTWQSVKGQ